MSATRQLARSSLRAILRLPGVALRRPVGRRSYADMQHRVAQSSDLPWLIGAIAVTVPGCVYLYRAGQSPPASDHGDASHGEHDESHQAAADSREHAEDSSEQAEDSSEHAEVSGEHTEDGEKVKEDESTTAAQGSEGGDGNSEKEAGSDAHSA